MASLGQFGSLAPTRRIRTSVILIMALYASHDSANAAEDLPNVAQQGGLSATQLRRIGIAVSAIDQTHSAEACWPMKGSSCCALPFTILDGMSSLVDAITFRMGNNLLQGSNSVNFLSARFRAEFTTANKQGARLRYEHPAGLAPGHLRGTWFSRSCPGYASRRWR